MHVPNHVGQLPNAYCFTLFRCCASVRGFFFLVAAVAVVTGGFFLQLSAVVEVGTVVSVFAVAGAGPVAAVAAVDAPPPRKGKTVCDVSNFRALFLGGPGSFSTSPSCVRSLGGVGAGGGGVLGIAAVASCAPAS